MKKKQNIPRSIRQKRRRHKKIDRNVKKWLLMDWNTTKMSSEKEEKTKLNFMYIREKRERNNNKPLREKKMQMN